MSQTLAPPPPMISGPVTRTDIVRYQGASGDMYRVHHDEPYAIACGFPSAFSVGMYQAGLLATWAVNWLGAENVRRFRVRFKDQVWPGDILTSSGRFLRDFEENGEHRVEIELVCAKQNGSVAAQAWATFVVV